MASQKTKGECYFCEKEMTKGGMIRHLSACKKRQQTIDKKQYNARTEQNLYHLQVYEPYGAHYWLNLEIKSTARLNDLDDYLRAIWLECCGHLSQFSAEGRFGREIPMTERIYNVFNSGMEITHIYDFGTSTETVIKMVGKRRGIPLSSRPVYLMARNNPPAITCEKCNRPATWLDMEALFETGDLAELCTWHAENDPDVYTDELIPLVNSPRTGVCGYTGPADPPY